MSAGLRPLRAGRKVLAIFAVALLLAVAASFLPDNPYQRWQLVSGTVDHDAGWIYERTVFDPTPIDVAFVGSSRIAEGVDAPRLSAALRARGLPDRVVNFALPQEGRNLHYLVVRQMLEHKHPKLLVVGVQEGFYRWTHPAFRYLADRDLMIQPGLWTPNYLADLVYLPFRQMRLLAAQTVQGGDHLARDFDPKRYDGPTLATGGRKVMDDGSVIAREQPASPQELDRCLKSYFAGMKGAMLPHTLVRVDYASEYHYVSQITDLAARKGVKVVFLAVPYYTGPGTVADAQFYMRQAPVWRASFLARRTELYADCLHLDGPGSRLLTDWLTPTVADALRGVRP